MSRVPADTVLLRLALAAVIALPLSGCGGDDAPEQASTPPGTSIPQSATTSSTPPTPTATTPTTPGAKPSSGKKGAAASDPALVAPAADEPSVSETPASAEKASPKKASSDEIAGDMKKVHEALKKEGYDPGKPIVSDESSGALQVKETTIVFFPSPKQAAAQAAKLKKVFEGSPQFVTVDRKANRLFLLSLPAKPTDEQLSTYRKIRQIANGAV